MLGRKIKISKGLNRLLLRKDVQHFQGSRELFLENPDYSNRYSERFTEAQLLAIAYRNDK
jgi:hypothetical protein